jgi:tetratricopeptide (TPR) repeat protein
MSNSFPKVSPDGRWIVFVQARNGQLMRPDSQLYIVPAAGGRARRMRCNTSLMNSWHSFSPNGRWMVFSSKARSPYTQMYLTHIDKEGRDSPPILIENATAANRAVNIPEFVNVPPDGIAKIDVPAVEFYKLFDQAFDLAAAGQFDEAIPKWRRALELTPESAAANLNLGIALAETGELDSAIERYGKALEIQPDYAEVHNNMGSALARTGRLEEAIEQYQASIRIDPESAEAYNNLAVAQVRAGKQNDAIASFRKAVELSPESAEFHTNLGRALASRRQFDEAIRHFKDAVEVNPDYLQARNNLGLVFVETERFDEAISEFEYILAADAGAAQVHGNLARVLARSGRVQEAVEHFGQAAALDPDSAEAQNSLGVALMWVDRPEEATPHFEKAVALNPKLIEAHHNLGDIRHYIQGRTPEALAHWREVLLADPNHVLVLQQTARVLATSTDEALRDGGGAVALAERAAELSNRRDPTVLDTLAAAYAEAGRFPEAVETARAALAIANDPRLVEALESNITLYSNRTPLRRGAARERSR